MRALDQRSEVSALIISRSPTTSSRIFALGLIVDLTSLGMVMREKLTQRHFAASGSEDAPEEPNLGVN